MAGGLMNLISYGTGNIILNGNPKKTFFKVKYNKFTNFGMQRIRIDFQNQRQLQWNAETTMEFKIPRSGELLHDTYIVINIPDIWSPLFKNSDNEFIPYEFKWVDNLACALINDITIHSGGNILNRYSGDYLHLLKERDLTETKKKLWNRMTGNTEDLNDPAKYHKSLDSDGIHYIHKYPSIHFDGTSSTIEPSIRGKQLFIPLASWFCTSSKMALPLVSLQYQEIFISITFAPISNLYKIRDINDATNNFPYISPLHYIRDAGNDSNGNPREVVSAQYEIQRFINPPTEENFSYTGLTQEWNSDIHLIGNFIFLDKQEQAVFARDEQRYLIREVHEEEFPNIAGTQTINVMSRNMVIGWTFRFRRTDVHKRNEWFNYSNWEYKNEIPVRPSKNVSIDASKHEAIPSIYIYNQSYPTNVKEILLDLAIQMDGKYRENLMTNSLFKWGEKATRTTGCAEDGILCYNFCLNTNKSSVQPSGAMNVNKFSKIQFTFNTIEPPINPTAEFDVDCDPSTGEIIGIRKNNAQIYLYNYDLLLIEERYNVIIIQNGSAGLLYAR